MSKTVFKSFLASIGLLSLSFSLLVTPVSAQGQKVGELRTNKRQKGEIKQIIQSIQDKDPQKAVSEKLSQAGTNPGELVSQQQDLQVKFKLKDKKIQLLNSNKGDLSLKIPNGEKFDAVDVLDNKVIYSGKGSKFDVVVEAVDGGLRQVINIKSSDAPSFYDFPMELGAGDKLEMVEQGASVKDVSGNVKVFVGKPWAIDANKKELKTWYSVENGNILRQHIDFTEAVFPVVADPIWCGNAISYVTWIYRDNLWSASNHPTWCGAWECAGQWACWQESYSKTPNYGYIGYNVYYVWNKSTNYWSMYNQFMCHANGPKGLKVPWNLEPARADKGYLSFVLSGCN